VDGHGGFVEAGRPKLVMFTFLVDQDTFFGEFVV
jgi:hypothetical protein